MIDAKSIGEPMSRRSPVIDQLGDPTREGFAKLRKTIRAREETREEQERRAEHDREMRRQWNRGSIIIALFTFGYCVWLTYNVFS